MHVHNGLFEVFKRELRQANSDSKNKQVKADNLQRKIL
jgi:hypothetical protein